MKVTIQTYEEIYLDFLEGNLGEETSNSLLTFLEDHPELKWENEEIIPLKKEEKWMDHELKYSLKQTDFQNDEITTENIESFLIAQSEELLSNKRLDELIHFLHRNPAFLVDQKRIHASRFHPDLTIIYPDKKNLQKKETKKIGWISIAIAIAASFILFFMLRNGNELSIALTRKHKIVAKNEMIKQKVAPKITTEKRILNTHFVPVKMNQAAIDISKIEPVKFQKSDTHFSHDLTSLHLKNKEIKPFQTVEFPEIDERIEEPVLTLNTFYSSTVKNEQVNQLFGFDDMKNPIAPITNQLKNLMQKDVDFKMNNPTDNGSRKIYIKIGKLIIYKQLNKIKICSNRFDFNFKI